jgi:hypothetical protein
MGLEASRLARNNADWQRLLEICALAHTLILDEDGVYDPTSFNDRLLLGLKGTMSEAELHVINARLRGGILNKVTRGEYRCSLPTGLIYDQSGNVTLDPDSQIREIIIHFFDTFSRVGSACQTVKAFRMEGLLFPSRLCNSETTVFRPLTASTAIRVLNNPRFAGAYAYGRRRYRRAIDGKRILQRRDQDDWLACIPDAHPGHIAGSYSRRISRFSRPTVRDMRWRARRLHGKVRRSCRDERCADDAANISVSATLPGADGWKPGIFVTAPTAIATSLAANRSLGLPSTKPWAR